MLPLHIAVGLDTTIRVGPGVTLIEINEVAEQPPFAPVTVYVVLIVGVTTTLLPVNAPGFQVYVVAPLAVNVEGYPAHIEVLLALTIRVGVVFTLMVIVFVLVQPEAFAPVNVYVVVVVGFTAKLEAVAPPGFQVYVAAPLPVRVAVLPLHIEVDVLVAVRLGTGLTVMLRVAVPLQPEALVPVTV